MTIISHEVNEKNIDDMQHFPTRSPSKTNSCLLPASDKNLFFFWRTMNFVRIRMLGHSYVQIAFMFDLKKTSVVFCYVACYLSRLSNRLKKKWNISVYLKLTFHWQCDQPLHRVQRNAIRSSSRRRHPVTQHYNEAHAHTKTNPRWISQCAIRTSNRYVSRPPHNECFLFLHSYI